MIDYQRTETTVVRQEFAIASPVNIGEMKKIMGTIWSQYCTAKGFQLSASPSDDWCQVESRDDEIVFSFETSRKVRKP